MIDIVSSTIGHDKPTEVTGKPHVVILLDESGSMASHRDKVISTFNEYVASVKDTAHDISLYTFDSLGIREKIFQENPSRIRKLTEADYAPNAMTPLYDAMGKVLTKFDSAMKVSRPVQFVTHTDGEENDSKEWNFGKLSEYIGILTSRGWLFTYLAEGLKGQDQLKQFQGLKMNFSSQMRGAAMHAMAESTASYARTGSNLMSNYVSRGDSLNVDAGEKLVDSTKQ